MGIKGKFRTTDNHDYFWAINMINKLTVLFKLIPASVRGIPLSTLQENV